MQHTQQYMGAGTCGAAQDCACIIKMATADDTTGCCSMLRPASHWRTVGLLEQRSSAVALEALNHSVYIALTLQPQYAQVRATLVTCVTRRPQRMVMMLPGPHAWCAASAAASRAWPLPASTAERSWQRLRQNPLDATRATGRAGQGAGKGFTGRGGGRVMMGVRGGG